jgi:signal transduction histidine kinase
MRSIELRVVAFVAAGLIGALAAFAWIVGGLAERSAMATLEARLDQLATTLASSLDIAADGTLEITRAIDEPAFERPRSGWTWRATRGGTLLGQSRSMAGEPSGPGAGDERIRRSRPLADASGAEVTVTAPLDGVRAEVAALRRTILSLSLALGVVLTLGTAWLIHRALAPIRAMARAIAELREGRCDAVPAPGLSNLDPVVDQVNQLSATLRHRAERGLRDAENLAHAIKTPLSVIALRAAAGGPSADPEIRTAAARIARQIDLRLRRVRSAAAGTLQARTPLSASLDDAVLVARHAHGGSIAVSLAGALDASVAGTREQLDEILGPLVDNAVRHARREVAVVVAREARRVAITITDDGPGIPSALLERVQARGGRLDERADSDGLGLAIAGDIIADLDGRLVLSNRQDASGLIVQIALPAA